MSACRRFVSTLLHPHAEIASIEYFAAGRQSVAQPIIELEAFGAARNLRRQSLEQSGIFFSSYVRSRTDSFPVAPKLQLF